MIDSDLDNVTETCDSCGISNCKRCFAEAFNNAFPQKCWQCLTGYALYDKDTQSSTVGTACKKCPTGCDTCSVEYGTGTAYETKCASNGCTAWDGKKAYTAGETGKCVQCPSNCKACTYSSGDNPTTTCTDGQCNTKYAKNSEGNCEACPDKCLECELNSESGNIECTDTKCESGYGKSSEGKCDACPSNCGVCSLSGATDDTKLYCDTCKSGYVLNEDVCGACPSNCEACEDKDGSMTCTKCKAQYALDSSKACVKCASNCKTCSATKCTECDKGYALAADALTCIACGTAAFDNCIECGNVDSTTEKALCEKCSSGNVLQDGKKNASCVDASSLDCGKGSYKDNPAECDACSAGFEVTKNKLCAKMCFSCGDVEGKTYVEKSACSIPQEGSNDTTGTAAALIPCLSGVCYAAYNDGRVMAGCMPLAMTACSDLQLGGETCRDTDDDKRCEQCCTDSKCNTFASNLDGQPDSAMLYAANMLLLLAGTLLSLYI